MISFFTFWPQKEDYQQSIICFLLKNELGDMNQTFAQYAMNLLHFLIYSFM